MPVTYRLRDDTGTLVSMQRASLSDSNFGLRKSHGLVGSDEWWAAIQHGALPTSSEAGEILRVWLGQGQAGPVEIEIRTAAGVSSKWLCNLEPEAAKRELLLGRPVFVEYVVQELKVPFNGSRQTKVVLAMTIG